MIDGVKRFAEVYKDRSFWTDKVPCAHCPQIAGQRGPMRAIFLQQRALHLPGAVEHWAAVPATLLEHRCNLSAPLRDLFLFGGRCGWELLDGFTPRAFGDTLGDG